MGESAGEVVVLIKADTTDLASKVDVVKKALGQLNTGMEKGGEAARFLRTETDQVGVSAHGTMNKLANISMVGPMFERMAGSVGNLVQAMTRGNAQFETFEIQLGVMLKGTGSFSDGVVLAKERIAELAKFANETPMALPQIVEGEKMLQTFGLSAEKAMGATGESLAGLRTIIGDAASMTAQGAAGFKDLAMWVGRFKSGNTGEALMRLTELGVATRAEMTGLGIEFDKMGSLADKSEAGITKATTALVSLMKTKFGGGMAEQAKTFDGMKSTLEDTMAEMKRVAMVPIFEGLKEQMAGTISMFQGLMPACQQVADALALLPAPVTAAIGAVGVLGPQVASAAGALYPVIATATALGPSMKKAGAGVAHLSGKTLELLPGMHAAAQVLKSVGPAAATAVGGTTIAAGGLAGIGASIMGVVGTITGVLPTILAIVAVIGVAILAFKTNFLGVGDAVRGVVDIIMNAIGGVMNIITSFFDGVSAFVSVFSTGMEQGGSVMGVFSLAWSNLAAAMQDTPLGALFDAVRVAIDAVAPVLTAAGNVIQSVLGPALEFCRSLVEPLERLFTALGVAIKMVFGGDLSGAINVVQSALSNFFASVAEGIGTFFSSAGAKFNAAFPVLQAEAWKLVTGIGKVFLNLSVEILKAIPPAIAAVANFMMSLPGKIISFEMNIGMAFLNLIRKAILGICNYLGADASGNVLAAFGFLVGRLLAAIYGVVAKIGAAVSEWKKGFDKWCDAAWDNVKAAFGRLWEKLKNALTGGGKEIGCTVKKSWGDAFKDWCKDAIPNALKAIDDLLLSVQKKIEGGWAALVNAARTLGAGIAAGVEAGATGAAAPAGPGGGGAGGGAEMPGEGGAGPSKYGAAQAWAKNQAAGAKLAPVKIGEAAAKGAGAGGGGGKAAGGGGGGGAAGQDAISAAMQMISAVSGALSGLIDFAEKAFHFRGFPPPSIMDKLFKGLKDIMDRMVEILPDIGAEEAALQAQIAGVMSAFVGVLSGLVDLCEKLPKLRPPPASVLTSLFQMAKWLVGVSLALSELFTSGAGLEDALVQAAVSSKVAEALKTWADTMKAIAEATEALSKGRWDVPLGPVMAFIETLAGYIVAMSTAMKLQLKDELAVVLGDAEQIANTLKPFVDLMKGIAELTQLLYKTRWVVDLKKPMDFITQLLDFVLVMRTDLLAKLGYELIMALDDATMIGNTLGPWVDALGKVADAVGKMASARWGDVDMTSVLGFVGSLWDAVWAFTQACRVQLGPMILLALADATAIAAAITAWADPLSKIGDAVKGIEEAARLAQRHTGAAEDAMVLFTTEILNMAAGAVAQLTELYGAGLGIALDDMGVIAKVLLDWVGTVKALAETLMSLSVAAAVAQRTAAGGSATIRLYLSIMLAMANDVIAECRKLDPQLLVLMQSMQAVGAGFGAWMDMLAKTAAAVTGVEKAAGALARIGDSAFTLIAGLFDFIKGYCAAIVVKVQKTGDVIGRMAESEAVAKAFDTWLGMLSKISAAAESIRKFRLDPGCFDKVQAFLAAVSKWSWEAFVQKIAKDGDALIKQGVSQAVAQTFGAWLDMLAKVAPAANALASAPIPPAQESLEKVEAFLEAIAKWSWDRWVSKIVKGSDPEARQKISQTVAQTFGAWLDMFAKVKAAADALRGFESVSAAEFDTARDTIWEIMQRANALADIFTEPDEAKRDLQNSRMTAFVTMATGALGIFKLAAEATRELHGAGRVLSADFERIKGIIAELVTVAVELANDPKLMPLLEYAQTEQNRRMTAFATLVSAALAPFKAVAEASRVLADAVRVPGIQYAKIIATIQTLVALVDEMSGTWLASLTERLFDVQLRTANFAAIVQASLGPFKAAAEASKGIADAVMPSYVSFERIKAVIKRVVEIVDELSGDFFRDLELEMDDIVKRIIAYTTALNAAIAPLRSAATLAEDCYNAVLPQQKVFTAIRDTIREVMTLMESLAADWSIGKERLDKAAEQMKLYADTVLSAVKILEPVTKAMELLADPGLIRAPAQAALNMIEAAIPLIVAVMDRLSGGFVEGRDKNAASKVGGGDLGTFDKVALDRITSFSEMIGKILAPITSLVTLMTTLHNCAGMLGGVTSVALEALGGAVTTLTDLMLGLADHFEQADLDARKATERAAEFATKVGNIVKPLTDVIKAAEACENFVWKRVTNYKGVEGLKERLHIWGETFKQNMSEAIIAMIDAMNEATSRAGATALNEANAQAPKVKAVADALGAVIGPIAALLENPFVGRARTYKNGIKAWRIAGEKEVGQFAESVTKGIIAMINALSAGFSGAGVVAAVPAGLVALTQVMNDTVALVQKILDLPDFNTDQFWGKIPALKRLGVELADIGLAMSNIVVGADMAGVKAMMDAVVRLPEILQKVQDLGPIDFGLLAQLREAAIILAEIAAVMGAGGGGAATATPGGPPVSTAPIPHEPGVPPPKESVIAVTLNNIVGSEVVSRAFQLVTSEVMWETSLSPTAS